MFELGVCRSCRVEYLVGNRSDTGGRFDAPTHEYGSSDYLLCRPPIDDDEDAAAGHDISNEDVVPMVLCPACAVLVEPGEACGCDDAASAFSVHLVQVPADEPLHTCPACRSRTTGEVVHAHWSPVRMPRHRSSQRTCIRPSRRAEIDNSTSVSGQGRKLLIFSDSRQDAAFFAAFLDRTYCRSVQRRVLFEATTDLEKTGTPRAQDVLPHARQLAEDGWLLDPDESQLTNTKEVAAWLVQELMAIDRRQSLEGTGMADIAVAVPRAWEPPPALLRLGFSEDEAPRSSRYLLDTVRLGGAVAPPDARGPPRRPLRATEPSHVHS